MKRILAALLPLVAVVGCAPFPPLPANVTITPDPVDFGQVFVGDSKTANATLTNGTAANVQVVASSLAAGTVFAGSNPAGMPGALAARASMTFPFTFTPPSKGPHQGTWYVTIGHRPYAVTLQGEGVLFVFDPTFAVAGGATPADGLEFGDVDVGRSKELEIKVRNLGGAAVVFAAAPAIAPPGPFTVPAPAGAFTLNAPPARSKVDVKVVFKPTAAGRFTGVLTWTDNAGTVRLKCQVSGNGVVPEEGH